MCRSRVQMTLGITHHGSGNDDVVIRVACHRWHSIGDGHEYRKLANIVHEGVNVRIR